MKNNKKLSLTIIILILSAPLLIFLWIFILYSYITKPNEALGLMGIIIIGILLSGVWIAHCIDNINS